MLEREERIWTAKMRSNLWSVWRETETAKNTVSEDSDSVIHWDGKMMETGNPPGAVFGRVTNEHTVVA